MEGSLGDSWKLEDGTVDGAGADIVDTDDSCGIEESIIVDVDGIDEGLDVLSVVTANVDGSVVVVDNIAELEVSVVVTAGTLEDTSVREEDITVDIPDELDGPDGVPSVLEPDTVAPVSVEVLTLVDKVWESMVDSGQLDDVTVVVISCPVIGVDSNGVCALDKDDSMVDGSAGEEFSNEGISEFVVSDAAVKREAIVHCDDPTVIIDGSVSSDRMDTMDGSVSFVSVETTEST